MAAAAAAVRNYFENVLAIPQAAREALIQEGLDNFDVFGDMTDEGIRELPITVGLHKARILL